MKIIIIFIYFAEMLPKGWPFLERYHGNLGYEKIQERLNWGEVAQFGVKLNTA